MGARKKVEIAGFSFGCALACISLIRIIAQLYGGNNPREQIETGKNVWAFYQGIWGNPSVDGQWITWNQSEYEPPSLILSALYPNLGPYSSHDTSVIRLHCKQMVEAGIDGVILHWWGTNDSFVDQTLGLLIDASNEFGIKVGVQIENYDGRSAETIADDIASLHRRFRSRMLQRHGKPVIFINNIDILSIPFGFFDELRNTYDSFFVAVTTDRQYMIAALEIGVDAICSFVASDGSVWSAEIHNWKEIVRDCNDRSLEFLPTVAPGFFNEKTSPEGKELRRDRQNGAYYEGMWRSAINSGAAVVVINSFNSWIDGTMIEPIYSRDMYIADSFSWVNDGDPGFYLRLTQKYAREFKTCL